MKTFTIQDIESWGSCYSPTKYLPEDWQGTALDILNLTQCPFKDRLWVIMRTELVSEKLMRLFAVWCARQVQHLITDERSLKALDVAEAFANGKATRDELCAARGVVWHAARGEARDAAWYAAGEAAREAARSEQEAKLREMLLAGINTGDVVCEPGGTSNAKIGGEVSK